MKEIQIVSTITEEKEQISTNYNKKEEESEEEKETEVEDEKQSEKQSAILSLMENKK